MRDPSSTVAAILVCSSAFRTAEHVMAVLNADVFQGVLLHGLHRQVAALKEP